MKLLTVCTVFARQFMRSLNVEEIEQLHEGPPDIPGEGLIPINPGFYTHVSKPQT